MAFCGPIAGVAISAAEMAIPVACLAVPSGHQGSRMLALHSGDRLPLPDARARRISSHEMAIAALQRLYCCRFATMRIHSMDWNYLIFLFVCLYIDMSIQLAFIPATFFA